MLNKEKTGYETTAIEAVKRQIKLLNWVVVLTVSALIFLALRFLYSVLDYVPPSSVVAILGIVVGLVILGAYLTNAASRKAIKKIDEYNHKLGVLLRTTRDIREIVYGDVLLYKVVDGSLKITGADAGSILLSEKDTLVFKVVKGKGTRNLAGVSIPKSHGFAGWVVSSGSAVRVGHVENDSRFHPEADELTGYPAMSVLCVPLRLSSGIIGALELVNKKRDAFTREDEDLIAYFADQAAISIDRANFYEDQKNFEIHLTNILIGALDGIIFEKRGHSRRVAKYTLLMARAMNMPDDQRKKLYRASLLHDIGFLKLRPDAKFSEDQYKAHSQIAFEMLQPINFYADIAPIIKYHHERYDGTGYPTGIRGEAIPLESRMIAIAEAFDAMVSRDSYKHVGKVTNTSVMPSICGYDSAIEELKKNAGTQFDPDLVNTFVNNIDEGSVEER